MSINVYKQIVWACSLLSIASCAQAFGPSVRLLTHEGVRAGLVLKERVKKVIQESPSDTAAKRQAADQHSDRKKVEADFKKKLKKTTLWGLSSCNGFTYTVGIALNAELLQPFLGDSSGIVVAAACYTVATACVTRFYAKQALALYGAKKTLT